MTRLGVNVDHVATLRQARRGTVPSPLEAALAAQRAGADGITVHLREDRRHIQDRDVVEIAGALSVPLNLEMAVHPSVLEVALRVRPPKACIVPERREELTTEGGLDLNASFGTLRNVLPRLQAKAIEVSLFIDPVAEAVAGARRLGAECVELHTGRYAEARREEERKRELDALIRAAELAREAGLRVNAGHGLNLENTGALVEAFPFEELNIGHSIVARALAVGIGEAVREMKALIEAHAGHALERSRH